MTLDGAALGRLIAYYDQSQDVVEHADLWVLRILADQAAVSMHTATLYSAGADLRLQAQQLYDEIARSSQDLRTRTAELERAEGRLRVLHQRELLDAERHRIALELHDSVAQHVLSAGLAVDVCRAEAADRGDDADVQRLTGARDLIAKAGDQVRSVIYALHHQPMDRKGPLLPELLQGLAAQHRPNLAVTIRLEGRLLPISAIAEQALARIAGEALFNVSLHAQATRAVIRLRYAPEEIMLSISDDGGGDPAQLRRLLRLEARADSDGRHQGLANMARRTQELGGTFIVRRSKLGGIRLDARVPAAEAAEVP
jgi:signal transduction histidine kinase